MYHARYLTLPKLKSAQDFCYVIFTNFYEKTWASSYDHFLDINLINVYSFLYQHLIIYLFLTFVSLLRKGISASKLYHFICNNQHEKNFD